MVKARALFHSKNVFLFDLDGTLYLGKKIIPGALELIQQLRVAGKKVFFFTNNSSRSLEEYVSKLSGFGFSVSPSEVVMSTHTLITELKRRNKLNIYLLGTPAMASMLESAGIRLNAALPEIVVVGFDKTLTYEKLLKASRLIASGTPYIVTHPDFFCPTDEGPEPDCGAIAKMLELTTKKIPVAVMGKPHRAMIDEVRRRCPCSLKEMILVGDRLMTDILMAKNAKIQSILVLTGESTKKDLARSKAKPSAIVRSVRDLLAKEV